MLSALSNAKTVFVSMYKYANNTNTNTSNNNNNNNKQLDLVLHEQSDILVFLLKNVQK